MTGIESPDSVSFPDVDADADGDKEGGGEVLFIFVMMKKWVGDVLFVVICIERDEEMRGFEWIGNELI